MGISIWQLVIVLVIVLLLFGTKKLRNVGSDLGSAIKNFKTSMKAGGESTVEESAQLEESTESVVEGEVAEEKRDRA